jgi:hypothetical protein
LPGILKAFLKYSSLFPVGSLVGLSNHTIGKVIQANGTSYAKPVISVLTDKKGDLLPHKRIYQVDLTQEREISIIRTLPFNYLGNAGIMVGF